VADEPPVNTSIYGDGMVIRQSDLSAWMRCNLQKHYYDTAKVDPTAVQPQHLSRTEWGTVLHHVIHVMEELHFHGKPEVLETALSTFEYYWKPDHIDQIAHHVDEWMVRDTYGGMRDRGRVVIEQYYELLKTDTSILLALEFGFAVPIEVEGRVHTLVGTVDRLSLRYKYARPYVSIDDWKSGKKPRHLRYNVQGTAYCLDPTTPVLMADLTWKQLGDVRVGERVVGVDEEPTASEVAPGTNRRYWREAVVEAAWVVEKDAYELELSNGQTLVASGDHRFVAQGEGSYGWRTVEEIRANLFNPRRKTAGVKVAFTVAPSMIDTESVDYRAGYLAGVNLGDGSCRLTVSRTRPGFWSLAVCHTDVQIVDRVEDYARSFGIHLYRWDRKPNGRGWQRQPMVGIRTHSELDVAALIAMEQGNTLEWKAGWLAGLYDTDGSVGGKSRKPTISIFQKDRSVLRRVQEYAAELGLTFHVHERSASLQGGRNERVRFCATVQPALWRKVEQLPGRTVQVTQDVRIVAVRPVGKRRLVDITTSTRTFVAGGVLTHNCYASTQPEFWQPPIELTTLQGFDDGTLKAIEDLFARRKTKLHEQSPEPKKWDGGIATRGFRWIDLQEGRHSDGGFRVEQDYARLRLAIGAYARANEAQIFMPTLNGDTCVWCPFRDTCGGIGLPADEDGRP
jgi:LAGLIDADG-like domain/PD-(D/E)XK nuclease superfamily